MTRGIILKWQKELPLIQRSLKTLHTSLRQFTTIIWRSAKERYTRTRMDDADYLVEDNVMDEFAYHRKWKRPMVEWHIGGAS